jgi:hypothetical protein
MVGSILLALAVMNMSMLPYPIWFWASNLVIFPLGFFWAGKLGGLRASTGGGTATDRVGIYLNESAERFAAETDVARARPRD